MSKDIKELLKDLANEKFNGKPANWKEGRWGDIEVLCAEDSENWYYRHGNVMYRQSKGGDHTPYCYGCNSELEVITQRNSIWYKEFSGPVGSGKVEVRHVPYCPSCENKPSGTGAIRRSMFEDF